MLELLDRVGLKTNVLKKFRMVCRLCQAKETHLEEAYGRWMTGAGIYCRERQRGRVQCTKCGEDMALRLMAAHMHKHYGKEMGGRRRWEATDTGGEPHIYRMAFPTAGGTWNFPIEGCPVTGGDKDGDAGPFIPPACPGYRHNFGGYKRPHTNGPPNAT